jgi:hypothetical protein
MNVHSRPERVSAGHGRRVQHLIAMVSNGWPGGFEP